MDFMTFHLLGRIIPTDELIFFRGVGQPPRGVLQYYHGVNIQKIVENKGFSFGNDLLAWWVWFCTIVLIYQMV